MIFHLSEELMLQTQLSVVMKKTVLIIFENFDSQKSAGRDHGQTQGIPEKIRSFCSGIYAAKGGVKA